jgi:spore germination protein GerM
MRPEEELIKKRAANKRKKSRNRRIKVVVILVAIVTVISLVFYTLDNPGFLDIIKNKITTLYSPDTETSTVEGSGNAEEAILVEEYGDGFEEVTVESEEETLSPEEETTVGIADSKNPSFLQKIKDFFVQRMSPDEDIFPGTLDIKFYFASLGEKTEFVYEERKINAGDPRIAVENTVQGLLSGPEKSFHYPVIPPGTELLDVEIYENIAKLNLSQDFLDNSLDSRILDEYVIYTIVNTVTQIPEIDGIVFFIDGARIKTYGDVDLSIPAIKNEKYLKEEE